MTCRRGGIRIGALAHQERSDESGRWSRQLNFLRFHPGPRLRVWCTKVFLLLAQSAAPKYFVILSKAKDLRICFFRPKCRDSSFASIAQNDGSLYTFRRNVLSPETARAPIALAPWYGGTAVTNP